jgi:hypothetical protein
MSPWLLVSGRDFRSLLTPLPAVVPTPPMEKLIVGHGNPYGRMIVHDFTWNGRCGDPIYQVAGPAFPSPSPPRWVRSALAPVPGLFHAAAR